MITFSFLKDFHPGTVRGRLGAVHEQLPSPKLGGDAGIGSLEPTAAHKAASVGPGFFGGYLPATGFDIQLQRANEKKHSD